MAVEASHHTLFHPQMMLPNTINNININIDTNQATGTTTPPLGYTMGSNNNNNINNPMMYNYSGGYAESMNNNNVLKAESGLTCSIPVSRKRVRDCSDLNTLLSFVNNNNNNNQNMNMNMNQSQNRCGGYTFLGEDISMQIQQQQLEIDQFIAHQTDKVRLDIEERRKRNSRRLIAAVEENISKRLRAKEEEIIKIAKLNWALEEKVKSLCVENQIWRELAQTNEATANALRSNLKQVLEQVVHDEYRTAACVDEADEAQSCCESNNEENRISLNRVNNIEDCANNNNGNNRLCKTCGKEESCVLLLPCRHLCLCTTCASSVNICPICKSTKNISVHVNMS
ncbi:BOI-related E3 ubiquitin-protein ligase 1-like [Bidens hawaiensis]|uniref:BOI-related E3 ubiquitin-protein ligase 1-like n=1 Tax=Bidens hawaiensis TaxID=980011 RepID=UPI004049B523